MVTDKGSINAVSDILGGTVGDLRPAMEAVADIASEEFVPGGVEGQVSPVGLLSPFCLCHTYSCVCLSL